MLKVKIHNQSGEVVGEQDLNPAVFGVKPKPAVVHQAVVAQMNNARPVLAHTKDRSEVRGGGKKPWQQKGTGRARAGSSRSPIWKGGGVTFGPTKERNFSQKINKKMKRQALLMVLSDKVKDEKMIVLDKLELAEIKTKQMNAILNKLPLAGKRLVVLEKNDDKLIKSLRNLDKIEYIRADSMNVLAVIKARSLLVTSAGVKLIEKIYGAV
ncbi:MAG: 50S ribosomal protein L4 [bacterium]